MTNNDSFPAPKTVGYASLTLLAYAAASAERGGQRMPELAQRLEDATRTLELMTGIYAQSARTAAAHRRHPIERLKQLPKATSPASRKR
jgi:hypothetical protein